jgi:hypothetical protein
MSHRLIRRAAILLALLLVMAAMAFSINTTQRERRLTARTGSVVTGPAPAAAYDAKLAAASFDTRCTKCHEMADMHEWLAANAGADRQGRLVAFLKTHRKAPDAESAAIARFLSESPTISP